MALSQHIEEIVNILSQFYTGRTDMLLSSYGDQAVLMAEEMGEMIGTVLIDETPFGPLWQEYVQLPLENEAELMGALEVLEETNAVLAMRLEGYFASFVTMRSQDGDIVESDEPEGIMDLDEIRQVESLDDGDDDDEYREENTYLVGNVEDHSTSAMYYETEDTTLDPNESEDS